MSKLSGLSKKEICELRIKCLEMFVPIASKTGIEDGIVFLSAEKAWVFVTALLEETPSEQPVKAPTKSTSTAR